MTASPYRDANLARQQQQQSLEVQVEPKAQLEIPHVDCIIGLLFGGGPMDLSVLQSYTDHMVGHVWIDQLREEMKFVCHGCHVIPYPTHL